MIFETRNLRIVVLPDKGTDISEIIFKPFDLNLLFRNPWGPLSPRQVPVTSPHDEVFRDYTGGGWSDILPNAGAACKYQGMKFGLHDETPLLPWYYKILESKGKKVSAKFWTDLKKYPFRVEKTLTLYDYDKLTINETIVNKSKQRLPFSWLIHPTFSSEFLGGTTTLDVAATRICHLADIDNPEHHSWEYPNYVENDGNAKDIRKLPFNETDILDDTLVLTGLERGHYDLTNESSGISFSLDWDKTIFPVVWYYRSINSQNYPYFGRSQFIAVEPSTSAHSGLADQTSHGDARFLAAGEVLSTELTVSITRI